jgi:hypothetical protein
VAPDPRIPLRTGRTWRDLPPEPPLAAPTPPVVPEAAQPVPAAARRRWPLVVGGLGVVLAGVLVGMVAFGGGPVAPALLASPLSPTTTQPADPIVPPTPPELGGQGSEPTDPLGLVEELGRLLESPLLDEFLRGLDQTVPDAGEPPSGDPAQPETEEPVRSIEAIVIVPVPPADHRISANTLYLEPDGLRQELVLTGPAGDIVVAGERGSGVLDPIGEPVAVRGTTGDLVEAGGRLVLSWSESDDVSVRIDAPAALGAAAVVALAESLEVAR